MFESIIKGSAKMLAALHTPHPAWLGMDRDMRKLMSLFERVPSPENQTPQKLRRSYRLSTSLWSLSAEQSITIRDEKNQMKISPCAGTNPQEITISVWCIFTVAA